MRTEIIGMLEPTERVGKRCVFCGSKASVKYIVKKGNSVGSACNRCVIDKNIKKENNS